MVEEYLPSTKFDIPIYFTWQNSVIQDIFDEITQNKSAQDTEISFTAENIEAKRIPKLILENF